jgi:hypothetical protein
VTRGQLNAVYELLCRQRDPFGKEDPDIPIKDRWDRSIYAYGREWQEGIRGSIGLGRDHLPTDWLPGKSKWVVQALEAYEANQVLVRGREARGGHWYSAAQFLALDFFRFNLAAKIHYRTVKQQLLAFGETLLGSWPDGAAYEDDLERVQRGLEGGAVGEIITEVGDIQRESKERETSEGMAILVRDLAECDSPQEGLALLERVIASIEAKEPWTYGVLDEDGKVVSSDAEKKLRALRKKVREELAGGGGERRKAKRTPALLPTSEDWESRSRVTFARRGEDSRLIAIDKLVASIQQYRSGPFRLKDDGRRAASGAAESAARTLVEACETWLEANRNGHGDKGRRGAVAWLKDTVHAWAAGA